MSPESQTPFEFLSHPNETLRPLTPADIDLSVMRQQFAEAGYKLNISKEGRASLSEKVFKRLSEGRGPGVVEVLGRNKTKALFDWCHHRSEGGPRLGYRDKETEEFTPTPGSEGRGLRQLAADIIQLVTDPAPTPETFELFCLKINQRVRKGLLESTNKKSERTKIREIFKDVPQPKSTFASVPPGSVPELWALLLS